MSAQHPASRMPQPAAPLAIAKLIAPPLRPGLVPRPQLLARLDAVHASALTLLSAPAGFGKTTLLSAWLAEAQCERSPAASAGPARPGDAAPRRFAWLSLEAEDSEPARFWSYVLAALRRALPALPADLDAPLRATPPQTDALVTGLANAVAALPDAVTLILDDYHTVADRAVHRSLAALVEHCPPGLRLVVAGRADPPLPLARLQAQGRLTQLRAADLRFGAEECTAFLRQTMGLDLSVEAVAALGATTEGWPAGLQLAALWLRDHPEFAGGLAALAHTDRYLLTFLAEEVIERQPPELQRFLLDTAILDRWCPELCDYLTAEARHGEAGQPLIARPAQQIIAELERNNLFVVALDPDGAWYRYHTLFGDALRRELARQRGSGAVTRLHRRAAAWLAAASADQPALLEAALRHALAGQAYELAADLITPRFDQLSAQGQIGQLIAWLAALPAAAVAARPALALRYAWALFLDGRQDEAAHWLATAEAALAAGSAPEAPTAALPHILRAAMATADHDDGAALRHAGRAADLLPPGATFWGSMIIVAHGLAHLGRGEAREAAAALQRAAELADQAESSYGRLVSLWHLGRTRLAMGRLGDAARAFGRIGADGERLYIGYRHVGHALVAYEQNELAEAHAAALRGLRAIEAVAGQPRVMIVAQSLLARLARASDEPAAAADWLDRAEELGHKLGLSEELAELLALRASFATEDGDLAAAAEWALAAGLEGSAPDVRREGELLVFARLLVARGDAAAGLRLAQALQGAAEAQGRTRAVVEWGLVRAHASERAGQGAEAEGARAEAARLARAAGLLRLLQGAAPAARALGERAGPGPGQASRPAGDSWHEALSERERRVLRLIAAGRSNQEIASALLLSVNTVKTHIKRIYEKLQVNSRVGAVERARERGLYP